MSAGEPSAGGGPDLPSWATGTPDAPTFDPSGGRRGCGCGCSGPFSLIALAVPLFFLGWLTLYGQDAIGTVANEGEADMGEEVVFEAADADYRVVMSGPLRPDLAFVGCDIVLADGEEVRLFAGEGEHFSGPGTDRVGTFTAVAGETSVTCARTSGGSEGRFQVVERQGLVTYAGWGLIFAAIVSAIAGILWFVVGLARGPADDGDGDGDGDLDPASGSGAPPG